MSNNKQSSIDWLYTKLKEYNIDDNIDDLVEQAKAMHKEEIKNAANNGCGDWKHNCLIDSPRDGNKYYNKTYGGNNE